MTYYPRAVDPSPGGAAPGRGPGSEETGVQGRLKLTSPYRERYVDLQRLGAGAQAAVYRATDTETGEPVALKLLADLVRAKSRGRLQREARALSSVVHPHLVRFVDLHEDHAPPLLVMELIEGEALVELVEGGGSLDPARVRDVIRALASALAALHRAGVVHRDVKLENVVLAPGRGPVLVDLGLADLEDAASLTSEGEVVGTPAYLAPEVLITKESGPAADVYALGVLAHRLLRGDFPFSIVEIGAAVGSGRLPEEPARRLGEALGPVVAATLEASPKARPTASNLELALGLSPEQTQEHLLPSEVRDRPRKRRPDPAVAVPSEAPPAAASPAPARRRVPGKWGVVLAGCLGVVVGLALDIGGRTEPAPPSPSPAASSSRTDWSSTAAGRSLLLRHRSVLALHRGPEGRFRYERLEPAWKAHLLQGAEQVLDPRFSPLVRGYLRALTDLLEERDAASPEASTDAAELWSLVEHHLYPLEHLLLDFEYWDPYAEGLLGGERAARAAAMIRQERRARGELQAIVLDPSLGWRRHALARLAHLRLEAILSPGDVASRLDGLLAASGTVGVRAARLVALWVILRNLYRHRYLEDSRRSRLSERALVALTDLEESLPEERLQELRVLALAAEIRSLSFGPREVVDYGLVRVDQLLDDLAASVASPGEAARHHLEEMLEIFGHHHEDKFPEKHPALQRLRRLSSTVARLRASS